jgi:pimeloyl-ACP methyl ester carboxylesterase
MQPQPTDPNGLDRAAAFASLGLTPYLARRELVSLGPLPLHGELYEYATDAPCVLFIPGIGTYSELYAESLAKLSDCGFNVLSVDLRGHGYSGGARGDYRIAEVVIDLKMALDYLDNRFGTPTGVLGCSIGSRLGLALSEADNRVRALLCHTLFVAELPPDLLHWWGWNSLAMTALWWPTMPVDFRTFIDLAQLLQHHPMGQFASSDERMVWHYPVSTLHSVFSEPTRVVSEPLGIPAAILIGAQDQVIQPAYARSLVKRLKQPFEYIEIADAGHMLPLENIEGWVSQCAKWLARTLNDSPLPTEGIIKK